MNNDNYTELEMIANILAEIRDELIVMNHTLKEMKK